MGLNLLDVDDKNMVTHMARYSFQHTKKRKIFWDNSRLPQVCNYCSYSKYPLAVQKKSFCFTGFLNDSYSWLVKPLICHITPGLTRGNSESILLFLCRRYFPKIQMALKLKYLEVSRNCQQKPFLYCSWRKSLGQDCNQQNWGAEEIL